MTGTSGAEEAAGAAAPSTGSTGDKWRQDAPDCIIRDGTSRRSRRPPDRIIRGQAAATRPGQNYPGWVKQQDAAHRGLNHLGQNNKERPQPTGLDSGERRPAAPGRIAGGGWSGLKRPRESGGRRRTKQGPEAKEGQQWGNDRRQRKGQRHGDAVIQRKRPGRGDAVQQ